MEYRLNFPIRKFALSQKSLIMVRDDESDISNIGKPLGWNKIPCFTWIQYELTRKFHLK